MTTHEWMKLHVKPNGELYCISPYIWWPPGDKEVALDGDFTAEELSWMADHMKQTHKES